MENIKKGDIVSFTNRDNETVVVEATCDSYQGHTGMRFSGTVVHSTNSSIMWQVGKEFNEWSENVFVPVKPEDDPRLIKQILFNLDIYENNFRGTRFN